MMTSNSCTPAPDLALAGDHVYFYVMIVLAVGSAMLSALIVVTHFVWGQPFVVRHIVSMIGVCDFLQSIAMIVEDVKSGSWAQDKQPKFACQAESVIYLTCRLASLLWTVGLVLYMVSLLRYQHIRYRYTTTLAALHLPCWGIPLASVLILAGTRGFVPQANYVLSGGCTPKLNFEYRHGKCLPTINSFLIVFFLVYFWVIYCILCMAVLFMFMVRYSYRRLSVLSRQKSRAASHFNFGSDGERAEKVAQAKVLVKANFRLAIVAAIYMITWVPDWILYIQNGTSGPQKASVWIYLATYLTRSGAFIQSYGNFVVYALLSPDFFQGWRGLLAPLRHPGRILGTRTMDRLSTWTESSLNVRPT